MFDEMADHRLQLALHDREQVGAWNQKVFEVRRGKDQHFARAIDAIVVIAVAGPGQCRPAAEVGQFLLRSLREEVVGETHRQLSVAVQLVHHAVSSG